MSSGDSSSVIPAPRARRAFENGDGRLRPIPAHVKVLRNLAILTALAAVAGACTFPADQVAGSKRPGVGGSVSLAITDPKTIEPSRASSGSSLLVVKQICRPLVEADPITGALRPGAAESWETSEDAKTFTFNLRAGVTFHNGREVEAQDYVYSLSRFATKDAGSDRFFFFERVVGYKDLREGRATSLAGVKAVNPQTLEISTTEPFAELPAILSHPAAGSAIPKEEVDKGAAFAAKPVCAGPYMLSEPREAGKDFSLVRFAGYKAESSAFSRGGSGYADQIRFVIVADAADGYKRLLEGKVQITPVGPDMLVQARRVRGRLESRTNGIISYLGFPVTKPPFDNIIFRKALALAVDRSEIIEVLLAGSRQMPRGFLPEGAGEASRFALCKQTVKRKADVAEAKAALVISKVDPRATKPKIYFNDGASGHESWLGTVAEQWKKHLGVEAILTPDEYLKFLDLLATGADGPFRQAWPVEYPSPEALFGPVFSAGSLDNYTAYNNTEFNDLLKKARATVSDTERLDLYVRAGRLLCNDLPALPMWFAQNHYAFHSSIAAAKSQRLDLSGDPILRELGRRKL